jgi:hypothetical protein
MLGGQSMLEQPTVCGYSVLLQLRRVCVLGSKPVMGEQRPDPCPLGQVTEQLAVRKERPADKPPPCKQRITRSSAAPLGFAHIAETPPASISM